MPTPAAPPPPRSLRDHPKPVTDWLKEHGYDPATVYRVEFIFDAVSGDTAIVRGWAYSEDERGVKWLEFATAGHPMVRDPEVTALDYAPGEKPPKKKEG